MSTTGELLSVKGYPILDAAGQPLTIDPNGGPAGHCIGWRRLSGWPSIGRDRACSPSSLNAKLTYYDNSAVIPSVAAQPVVDNPNAGVIQGSIEGSNVDAISEMTRLMSVTRAFERVDALLQR